MRKLSPREQKILTVCIVMVFVYFTVNSIYKPWQNKIQNLDEQIQSKQIKLQKDLKVIQKSKNVDAEYQRFASRFRQSISDEKMMSAILSEIEKVAKSINIKIADMKPKRVQREDFYNNFSVNLSLEGSTDSIAHFIHILQTEPHFFDLEDLKIDLFSPRSEALRCTLILSKIRIL